MTGQVVNVRLGVVEEGSFTVNGVAATSDGVVVSKAEHPIKCKCGEQRLCLLRFGLVPDDENMDDFVIQSLQDLVFHPIKDDS